MVKVGRPEGVRKILLKGIFWRIIIIEGILLVWSLLYRILMEPAAQPMELFWYAVRIVILIAIIIVFIMVTFRLFFFAQWAASTAAPQEAMPPPRMRRSVSTTLVSISFII